MLTHVSVLALELHSIEPVASKQRFASLHSRMHMHA